MKRTFPLQAEGKHPDRLLEATKNEIRKYIRREKKRELPEGFDYWGFNCSFGKTEDDAKTIHVADITENINTAKSENWEQFFITILREARKRTPRPKEPKGSDPTENTDAPE